MPTYPVPSGCQIPGLPLIYGAHFNCETGTFVEVGAYDGRSVSNTCCLADAGWNGYYVEPNPEFLPNLRKNHAHNPKVKIINVAVAEFEGEADFWEIGECSSLVFDSTAMDWGGNIDRKIRVKVTTLDRLLEENQIAPRFELLVIDVEMAELRVLSGFTVARWMPKMVIIEAHELDPVRARSYKAAPISQYFCGAGYQKVYADHINNIYVRP
jgi:FkbM family methyltransferase